MQNTPNLIAALPATVAVTCPAGFGYTGDNCRSVSLPALRNDLFWRNRAFHIEVGGFGGGQQSQQHVVTLVPTLNQPPATAISGGSIPGTSVVTGGTGACVTSGASVPFYWDIGVRGDTSPTTHGSGFTLSASNSILTSTAGGYAGNGNQAPGNAGVVQQYCNGARIPPENCASASASNPLDAARCRGFNPPPGRSETTGLSTEFTLGISPAATIDEGNNWINLGYGPLALNNSALYTSPGTAMPMLGNYSIAAGSPAVNSGANRNATNGVPDHDFFGNPRPTVGVDIGAVELGAASAVSATLAPSTWSPSTNVGNTGLLTAPAQVFTLTNTGSVALTGITQAAISGSSDFVIVRMLSNCGPAGNGQLAGQTTLAPGASCFVTVRFVSPASDTAGLKIATLSVSDAAGTQTSALSGTVTLLAMVPPPQGTNFGSVPVAGTTAVTRTFTMVNQGAGAATINPVTFSSGDFTRPSGAAGGTCGATLNAGASCTINVRFKPLATGARSAVMSVGPLGTAPTANLTGTGT